MRLNKIFFKKFFPIQLTILSFLLVSTTLFPSENGKTKARVYYPGKTGTWETREPEQVGMNPGLVEAAVKFAKENENTGPRDLAAAITGAFSREPFFEIVGPTKPRGGTNGMIIRHGYIVAEWGDTRRVDMTFSVTKSYLSTTFGLALDHGLVRDVHDKVKLYITDGKFDSQHNAGIEWHHLLYQTSDWEGSLWGTPDWADRPVPRDKPGEWQRRKLHEPGTHWKYNDVRVNLLAYSLLQVWRRPLPQVLREKIMDPIGASNTWRWHGYRNSWVTLDGMKMQSVSGGGHFGGGMFICTRDQARFGLLFLRKGNWQGKQLISEKWIRMLQVPTPTKPNYGYMWWLGPSEGPLKNMYTALGFGGNHIIVDEKNDLVVVARWMPKMMQFIQKVVAAIVEK
jgi:CubicO group peptidase (beta-lactamase class C family)